MPLKIVKNDITKMNTDAIVNTANSQPVVGNGCDSAVYKTAGYKQLLEYRKSNIGKVQEGDVFLTPGFRLTAKYIIHAVSPLYVDGNHGEEERLRSCYRKSLHLAREQGIRSIAFPLIAAGGFGYPKEEGMRIAVDEINAFLLTGEMDIYLVVFGDTTTRLGKKIYPELQEYIDRNYVDAAIADEYSVGMVRDSSCAGPGRVYGTGCERQRRKFFAFGDRKSCEAEPDLVSTEKEAGAAMSGSLNGNALDEDALDEDALDRLQSGLGERMAHLSDTFSQYLLYLIEQKGMENAEVYNRAIVDKKVFSKIKNNVDYHPKKITALCLCVGAKLNLDETRDLLARAGYALSPCDKQDIIFKYFIENEIYDMIELDIQLEEHGLPCIIE